MIDRASPAHPTEPDGASSKRQMKAPITKAIVLAAGRGARLGALTVHTPKPLLEVAGSSILARILQSLASNGIREVAVVASYLSERIAQARWDIETRAGLRLEIVRQDTLNGTGGAILAAQSFVAETERFVVGWGDVLMDRSAYDRVIARANQSEGELILAINRVADPFAGAAVYVDSQMRVTRVIEKPPPATSSTNWNNAGLFAARPILFDYVRKLAPSARGEIELTSAIAAMIDDGRDVRAVAVEGFWSDLGTPEGLALARDHFGRKDEA
jgi:glucose-1-phosphate thymidylyltransferase